MTAFPIEWHEECLESQIATLKQTKDALERLRGDFERDLRDMTRYRLQIQEAKRQGKKSFDREKFLKKWAAQQGKKEGA